jgi:predicted N-acyltransferase
MLREGVQFHWENQDYADFDAFLASMKMEKRKKLRQDRKPRAGRRHPFEHLAGARSATTCCVSSTSATFRPTRRTTRGPTCRWPSSSACWPPPDSLMMVLAKRGETPVAVALNLVGGNVMYGRYWGTQAFVSGLHFETCYVQSIDYCIQHGIARFEGGAQGVHKMSRGLVPTPPGRPTGWPIHALPTPSATS